MAVCGSVGEWSFGHRPLAEHMRAGLRRVIRRAYPRWGVLVSRLGIEHVGEPEGRSHLPTDEAGETTPNVVRCGDPDVRQLEPDSRLAQAAGCSPPCGSTARQDGPARGPSQIDPLVQQKARPAPEVCRRRHVVGSSRWTPTAASARQTTPRIAAASWALNAPSIRTQPWVWTGSGLGVDVATRTL